MCVSVGRDSTCFSCCADFHVTFPLFVMTCVRAPWAWHVCAPWSMPTSTSDETLECLLIVDCVLICLCAPVCVVALVTQRPEHGFRVRSVYFSLLCRIITKYVEVRLEQNIFETPSQTLEAMWYVGGVWCIVEVEKGVRPGIAPCVRVCVGTRVASFAMYGGGWWCSKYMGACACTACVSEHR